MEAGVLENADTVVTINTKIKELILKRYPFKKENDIHVIPQGFDPDDFMMPRDAKRSTQKMKISYSGSFLNYYTPQYFLEGLALAISKKPEMKGNVEACFIGTFPDEYKQLIRKLNLQHEVNLVGYVDHSACIKYLMDSDVLWMMINKTHRSDLHSTGKLYEYMGARKPILACVPDGVARESLKDYGAIKITSPDDVKTISDSLIWFYDMFSKKQLPGPNEKVVEIYDRKILTGELTGLFDSAAGSLINKKTIRTKTVKAV